MHVYPLEITDSQVELENGFLSYELYIFMSGLGDRTYIQLEIQMHKCIRRLVLYLMGDTDAQVH